MAKAGKGKSGKAKTKPVKKPVKKVDKVVEKAKVKKVEKKVEVKKVEKKPEVKKIEPPVIPQPIIPEEPVMPQPVPQSAIATPPLEPDIQEVHFTEAEFEQKFVKATFADFKVGQQVFIKDRYGDKWVSKLVDQIGVVPVDSAQFNDLVLRDEAYIKR